MSKIKNKISKRTLGVPLPYEVYRRIETEAALLNMPMATRARQYILAVLNETPLQMVGGGLVKIEKSKVNE